MPDASDPTPLKDDSLRASSYGLSQASQFIYDDGLLVLPVASDNPDEPPVVVRAHAPVARRRVEFAATKQGQPPVVPAPETFSGKDLFLSGGVVVTLPGYLPNRDGFVWKVGGHYEYVQTQARKFGRDDLETGGYPFTIGTRLGVRRSLTDTDDPDATGNFFTGLNDPYLHTTFPAFCFDVGLIG